MQLHLEGKRAFISGSTAGIGYAIADSLLNEGAEVIINGLHQKELEESIDKLTSRHPGSKVSGIVADFQQKESITDIKDVLPAVDILVNNVGVYSAEEFAETSDTDWQRMIDVNVMSGVRLSKLALPQMIEKGWGRIIFISSECSQLVPTDLIAYSSTKASIEAVSKGLAQICKGTSVTVNSVMPGSTRTEGAERFLEKEAAAKSISPKQVEEEFFESTRVSSLVSRFLNPIEISNVVTFLASPNSSAINGSVINATGGSVR